MILTTTIQLQETTKAALDKLKIIKREPYDSVIKRLMDNALSEETITRLSSLAIVNETLDSTVNRLLDRMEVRTKA